MDGCDRKGGTQPEFSQFSADLKSSGDYALSAAFGRKTPVASD